MAPTQLSLHSARPRRRWAVLLAALAIAAAVPSWGQAQDTDPVLAKVNGVEIRQSDLAIVEEEIGNLPQGATGEAKRDYLISYLTDMILISRAAEEQGLSGSDAFKRRFALMRIKVLMEILLQSVASKAVTEDAMHKVYEEAVKQLAGQVEVRARHILVETEDEAKAVHAELQRGTDFATLAQQRSKEPGAGQSSGDLGYFTKDQMVPEFSEAAFKLDKDKISGPVKTAFGWHIIRIEDRRNKSIPAFDQVKGELASFVMRKAQADLVARLRAQAKIERIGASPAPAQPAPAPAKK